MAQVKTIEVPVKGMDCTECTLHVQHALAQLPGVEKVDVFLASEKAILKADPGQVTLPLIRKAVADAGYSVPDEAEGQTISPTSPIQNFTRPVLTLFGIVFGAVLFITVVGEWLGLFEKVTTLVPWYVGLAVVLVGGYPVFANVIRATLKKQVISHTLMTMGVLAALIVGQWATAAVIVFFMRVGDYAERFTTERARRAVKDLTAMAPQTARVERDGQETEIPVSQMQVGETIIVRPGETIPVDGEVVSGQATINQAAITGESMPVEAGPGARVFAATLAQMGSLRIRTAAVGRDTTFGRVIKMVEEAESHRADVQRVADKFSAYYLPVVAGIAALTFLLRRDPLATAAVLVVACSCSFALATPIAMLASIGAGARRGLLIKGGKYLEVLARADVLLVDKTGTLTLGRPEIQEVLTLNGLPEQDLLRLAASVERFSEHPLAEAVRATAKARKLDLLEPADFRSVPGEGVSARVNGHQVQVGSRRIVPEGTGTGMAQVFEQQGKTLLWVVCDGQLAGLLTAADTFRSEVPEAFTQVRALGIQKIELLTGDNSQTAASLAGQLGIDYRADLLPEDKIEIVRQYQQQGHVVVMVGDGVNDAPALAQANIGIAMGAAGSDVAVETAHIALMREDWMLVPEVFRIARRTMRVVNGNIGFTTVYNVLGLTLAAFGILPPILAAAAQSLPDIGILANSSRLLKQ
jgi:Cd2+/Zn2+-exporting ATPase/Cu+-exporting ATPase